MRRRNTPPSSPDNEMTVRALNARTTHEPYRADSFQIPGIQINRATETMGVAVPEDDHGDHRVVPTAPLQPTSSMWRRILTAVQAQPTFSTEEHNPRIHRRPIQRYHEDEDIYPGRQPRTSLSCLKAAAIVTMVMVGGGLGWLSYRDWVLSGTIGQLTTATNQLLGTVGTTVGQVNSQIAAVTNQLGALDQRINTLTSVIGTVTPAVGNLQTELLRANTLANGQITSLTERVQTLTANLGNVTNALSDVQTLVPSAIAPAQAQINALSAQLSSVNGTLGTLQQSITPLTAVTPAALAQIQAVSSKVDAIKTQIAALQNLVSGALPQVTLPQVTVPDVLGGILPRP